MRVCGSQMHHNDPAVTGTLFWGKTVPAGSKYRDSFRVTNSPSLSETFPILASKFLYIRKPFGPKQGVVGTRARHTKKGKGASVYLSQPNWLKSTVQGPAKLGLSSLFSKTIVNESNGNESLERVAIIILHPTAPRCLQSDGWYEKFRLPAFEFWPGHLFLQFPQPLCLSVLICEKGIMKVLVSWGCFKD